MSKQNAGIDVPFRAPYDLSSYQYYFVKMSSTADYITLCSAGANASLGILQNKPTTAGAEAIIRCLGHSKFVGSASMSVGNLVGPDPSGKGQAVTAAATQTDTIMGIVTVAPSADGEVGEMVILPVVSNI